MRFLTLVTLLLSGSLYANIAASDMDAREAAVYCSREVFAAFYPPVFVSKTLEAFGVSKEKRLQIIGQLKERESEIVALVEKSAEKMEPNPLFQPNQQKTVVTLFDKAVLNVFSEVLGSNCINDQSKIVSMMEDVHRQKADKFRECMELNH